MEALFNFYAEKFSKLNGVDNSESVWQENFGK